MSGNKLEVCLMSTIGQDEMAYYKKRFAEFEKEHNLEVVLTSVSWNRAFSWLVNAFKNNQSPDIIQLGSTWVRTFAFLGYLDSVPSGVLKPVLAPWMETSFCFQGERVAQPWFVEIRALLVWKEILEKFDMDYLEIDSPEDLIIACRRLAREKKEGNCRALPFAFPIRPENDVLHRYITWHFASGGSFPSLEPAPEKILSGETFADSLNYFSGLAEVNNLPRSEMRKHPYVLYREFADEAHYVFYQGNWELRLGEEHGHISSDYAVMPVPLANSRGKYWGGGSVLTVSSRCQMKEAAWHLVDFMTSDDFMDHWVRLNGNMPAVKCKFWDRYREIENVNLGYMQIVNSITYPPHPMWATVEKILSVGLSNYFWQIVDSDSNNNIQKSDKSLSSLPATDKKALDFLALKWKKAGTEDR